MEPEVGTGVTYYIGSDSYPYTVVEVVRFTTGQRKGQAKSLVIQEDKAIRVSGSEYTNNAVYEYEPNPNGRRISILPGQNGLWHQAQGVVDRYVLGIKEYHRDPHF